MNNHIFRTTEELFKSYLGKILLGSSMKRNIFMSTTIAMALLNEKCRVLHKKS